MGILVATDFSPCSQKAIRLGAALAQRRNVPLRLVHAVGIPTADVPIFPMGATAREGELLAAAELAMGHEARALREGGVTVETDVLLGPAAAIIADAAREHQAELVVIGTHGRTGTVRLLMGSVAEGVMATSPCPVLVTREHLPEVKRHDLRAILVATDLSDASRAVLPAAYAVLRPGGGRVQLVHVHDPGASGGLAEVQAQLHAAIPAEAAQHGITTTVSVLEGGAAAASIAAAAAQMEVDLVAVGTHGRSGLRRALLGSVAAEVIRQSPRPVLVVRGPHGRHG